MRKPFVLALLAVAGLAIGCSKKEAPPPPAAAPAPAPATAPAPAPAPPAVASVTLGNAIGADKTIASPQETFTTKDKIYAAVATTGQGHVKLRALWSFLKGGKTTKVNETAIEFDASGPASNELHIENTKPWPKGDYQVEIFLGDAPAAAMTKTFKVQ